jgi:hypothetical protein
MDQSKLLDWKGQTCVILASGPSLTSEQVEFVHTKPVKTITTNSTAFVAPWADVFFAVDFLWWKTYYQRVDRKRCWTQDRTSAERFQLNYVRQSARPGLGKKEIQSNGNSGFASINLAYLFGCRRIVLVGMDMKLGPKGQRHHHPDHPAPMVQHQTFSEWVFKSVVLSRDLREAGCEVLNATPGSALTVFPKVSLEEALKC